MLSKLPLMLVSDAGYGSHRGQDGRRHRCNDLHNPLFSVWHNLSGAAIARLFNKT